MKISFCLVLALVAVSSAADPQNFPSDYEVKICTGEADVILLLDRSGSVGATSYQYLVGFALHLARTFNIDEDKVRLGVASYATTARREINLDVLGVTAFEKALMNLVLDEELTNIEQGLQVANEMLFDNSTGARAGATKMIIVTNDGLHTAGNPPKAKAEILHKDGVSIVSIGITEDVNSDPIDIEYYKNMYATKDEESRLIASSPNLYYYVETYPDLEKENFLKQVTETVCQRITVNGPIVQDTTASVFENVIKGYLVHTIPFSVADPKTSKPIFTLIDTSFPFAVDRETGRITTTSLLDFELIQTYVLRVRTTDQFIVAYAKDITVTINVIDVNDNYPIALKTSYSAELLENTDVGYLLFTLEASDKDAGTFGKIVYKITSSDDTNGDFALDEITGKFTVAKTLNRESKSSYQFKAVALDNEGKDGALKTNDISIQLKILDVNDNAPQFESSSVTLEFDEVRATGLIYTVTATDLDEGSNKQIEYIILNGNEDGRFQLNKVTGELILLSSFDYEIKSSYKLVIEARDFGTPSKSSQLILVVNIKDVDEPLQIDGPFDVLIPENYPTNIQIVKITATDPEKVAISYAIKESSPFYIDSKGSIKLVGAIDREGAVFEYKLTVTASAGAHTVETIVTITVTDINDNAPVCSQNFYTGKISEDAKVDDVVQMPVQISGKDDDATSPNNAFFFTIFAINPDNAFKITPTGVLSINRAGVLDYESANSVTLALQVQDKGSPTKFSFCSVSITIENANDNIPVFIDGPYKTSIPENTKVNQGILQVKAIDVDGNVLTYSISSGTPFDINSAGEIFVAKELDIETVASYSFQVSVSDGENTVTTSIDITLTDVNDNKPIFKVNGPFDISVNEDKPVGFLVYTFQATDADVTSPNNAYAFSIASGSSDFKIDAVTGQFTINAVLKHDTKGEYAYEIKVQDKGLPSLYSILKVNVKVLVINFATPKFIGSPYEVKINENIVNPFILKLQVEDPDINEQLTYSIVSPNVPFTIDASGNVRATIAFNAEQIFQYVCIIRVTDKGGLYSETTLTVNVNDVNDVAPLFVSGPNSFPRLSEDTPVGTVLGTYVATDGDRTSPNNVVMYTIQGGTGALYFSIDMNTGALKIKEALDYEKFTELGLIIRATDKGTPTPLHTDKGIEIAIANVNEFPPIFNLPTTPTGETLDKFEKSVLETEKEGYLVLTVSAKDADADSSVIYSIPANIPFTINSIGEIRLKSLTPGQPPLDYEQIQQYTFDVTATDNGGKSSTAKVVVHVIDVNDNKPIFKETNVAVDVPEDHLLGTVVTSVVAIDLDATSNGYVAYEIIDGNSADTFFVAANGEIRLKRPLDFETTAKYVLTIKASDKGQPPMSTTSETHATVTINVKDVNEKPVWKNAYVVEATENIDVGIKLITVTATDQDAGSNGVLMYSIISGNDADKFNLDMVLGTLTLKNSLDFEKTTLYTLTIRATDKGSPALDTSGKDTTVTIKVIDVNEKPIFEPTTYEKELSELAIQGTEVVTVSATDPDANEAGQLMYTILPETNQDGIFTIDMKTGKITTAKKLLDFSVVSKYTLIVRATDKGAEPRSTVPNDATVTIIVKDENNNPPVFSPTTYQETLSESSQINILVSQVFATDKDSGLNGKISYAFVSGNEKSLFDIDKDGKVFLVGVLDFETMKQFILVIRATDSGSPPKFSIPDATLTIDVTDANDHAPEITNLPATTEFAENKPIDSLVFTVQAVDKDTSDKITFSISESPFEINPTNGVIKSKQVFDRETKDTYTITVTVTDGKNTDSETLTIKITDVNDNPPAFVVLDTVVNISENEEIGFEVATVKATDKDSGDNANVMYSIIGQNEFFQIDMLSGKISLKKRLDFETQKQHIINVRATDKGETALDTNGKDAKVTVNVLDFNDNKPIFKDVKPVSIAENTAPTVIAKVEATDLDSGDNGKVMYAIISGNEANVFKIDQTTGAISFVTGLDFETVKEYKLIIRATDKGTPALTSAPTDAVLIVTVTDTNDNAPVFNPKEYTTSVSEGSSIQTVITQVTATDKDSGDNGKLMYTIDDGEGKELFEIDMNTGVIILKGQLDRETRDKYVLVIKATDKGNPSKSTTTTVTIIVSDENDNSPTFKQIKYVIDVSEDELTGKSLLKVEAEDKDIGINQEIMYRIVGTQTTFSIDVNTGDIFLKEKLDYETIQQYILTVEATDKGQQPRSSNVQVTINVLDVNDNAPVFNPVEYTESISESTTIGTTLTTVTATDKDSGNNGKFMYAIIEGDKTLFSIDQTTGVISLIGQLDFETKIEHKIIIEATDKGLNPLKSNPPATVTIVVTNANDNPPDFINEPYAKSINENVDIGTTVITVKAEDKDISDKLTYFLKSENVPFVINADTGVIKTSGVIDREDVDKYQLNVGVNDGKNTDMTIVTVTINDLNDNAPVVADVTVEIPEDKPIGTVITIVVATDKDAGDNSKLMYKIVAGNEDGVFELSMNEGVLTLVKAADYETKKVYELEIEVSDKGEPKKTTKSKITVKIIDVNDNSPQCINAKASVREDIPLMTHTVAKIESSDADDGVNGEVMFSITSGNTEGKFKIENGIVSAAKELDFETTKNYDLTITVKDKGTPSRSSECKLTIDVTDVNDNKPIFKPDIYTVTIPETTPVSTVLVTVRATDADSGNNGKFTFKIESAIPDATKDGKPDFVINAVNGEISVLSPLDASIPYYELVVSATDKGDIPLTSSPHAIVRITVVNVNKPPVFTNTPYDISIAENSAKGSKVRQITAEDPDNDVLTYMIVTPNVPFAVDNIGVITTTTDTLDRESVDSYRITVKVSDGEADVMNTFTITIMDTNDNAPEFDKPSYSKQIREDYPIDQLVLTVAAKDIDDGTNGMFTFSITDGNDEKKFVIDPITGAITLVDRLDFEVTKSYRLTVTATDKGSLFSQVPVEIIVTDVNDNAPIFEPLEYQKTFPEDVAPGTTVDTVKATDKDDGINGMIIYSIKSGNDGQVFTINQETGVITFAKKVDFESKANYTLKISAVDKGNPAKVSENDATVFVKITDINDNKPIFKPDFYEKFVPESKPVGYEVTLVSATDADSGDNGMILYKIESGNADGKFEINAVTGSLTLKQELNFEEKKFYNLSISATDKGSPSQSAVPVAVVYVNVLNENDNAPEFQNKPYKASVTEHVSDGTLIITVSAKDADGDVLTYSITSKDVPFIINPKTGAITTKGVIDREVIDTYTIGVRVSDGKNKDDSMIVITVNDINDNAPSCVDRTKKVPENFEVGQIILKLNSVDLDIGNNKLIIFEIVSGTKDAQEHFELDKNTGDLVLIKQLDFENVKSYTLNIRTSDKGLPTKTCESTITITVEDVNDNTPEATPITVEIKETEPVGTVIADVDGTDKDSGQNAMITYEIIAGNNDFADKFTINDENGKISIKKQLDFELVQKYTLTVKVSDKGQPPRSTSVLVTISIINVNDNKPVFTPQEYTKTIPETTVVGSAVEQVTANDNDKGFFGQITYMIVSGNADATNDGSEDFQINQQTGVITVKSPLDAKVSKYILMVKATDGGSLDSEINAKVTIIVTNVNVAPVFTNEPFEQTIPENIGKDKSVKLITATDVDGDTLKFFIVDASKVPFRIDENTGRIFTTADLDRETQSMYSLVVSVTDGKLTATTTCKIIISDINDEVPKFKEDCYVAKLKENSNIGEVFVTVEATDKDAKGPNSEIIYSIDSGNNEFRFEINSKSGQIKLINELDYETTQFYELVVRATDKGIPSQSTVVKVKITVVDVNDNRPVFKPIVYTVTIKEDVKVGTDVTTVTATDNDAGQNGEVVYRIVKGDENKFEIDTKTGKIIIKETVDFETQTSYELIVEASDKGSPSSSSQPNALVKITIVDVNDNAPIFEIPEYKKNIPETFPKGGLVVTVKATDKDSTTNADIVYAIVSGNNQNDFILNAKTGEIRSNAVLDVTRISVYNLVVSATDKGTPSKSTAAKVTITVTDVNMPPTIKKCGEVTILDDQLQTVPILTVIASDPDRGDNGKIMYELLNKETPFTINMNTGEVFVKSGLSTANSVVYTVDVKVTDKGDKPLSDTERCTINVLPSNRPPVITPQDTINVREDTNLGSRITTVVAKDSDKGKNGEITFAITGGNGNSGSVFKIDAITGVITLNEKLAFNKVSKYSLQVTVTDKGKPALSATTVIRINVLSVTKPVFNKASYKKCVTENEKIGTTVVTVSATDGDGDSLTYSITPVTVPFAIDQRTGVITTTKELDREDKSEYEFQAEVSDGMFTVSVRVSVCVDDVNDNKPVIGPFKSAVVCENEKAGKVVLNIVATDPDTAGTLTYKLLSDDSDFPFSIDETGKVTLINVIDFEKKEFYDFKIQVSDGKFTVTKTARIDICNINEHSPIFNPVKYNKVIKEDTKPTTVVVKVTATDKDSGTFGEIVYSIVSGGDDQFRIDSVTGEISVKSNLQITKDTTYVLVVRATDKGLPPRSSNPDAEVTIVVNKRAQLCNCELEALSFPELQWERRHIQQYFRAETYLGSLTKAVEHLQIKINKLNTKNTVFQSCEKHIRSQLMQAIRDYSVDELVSQSCGCRENIQSVTAHITKLQYKITCWEEEIRYFSRNMCPRYCKCFCIAKRMTMGYYETYYSADRCKQAGYDYSSCKCGC